MAAYEYRRLDRWVRGASNGWTSPDVAARFEAGTRGGHYLEILPFGPAMASAPAAQEVLELLARTGLEEAVLLDFGCGNGAYGALLAASEATGRWRYVGADVNRLCVESCRRRFPGDRFEVVPEDGPLPFAAASVDVILASGVVECVEDPNTLLEEFRRITRAWVLLCRLGVRPDTPPAMYWQTVRHAWGLEAHCFHVFNRTDLDAMIARAGFEIVWHGVSPASGEWVAPDDPVPMRHFSYLLRRATG